MSTGSNNKKIAFFDFDGTISTKDSYIEFLKFTHGIVGFYLRFILLSPILILYKIRIIPNDKAKQIVFSCFYKGYKYARFIELSDQFAVKKIPSIVKESALLKIKWHIDQGHRVIIVSASFESYLKKWCDLHQIELIGTHFEIDEGIISGKLLGKNCYGTEKVNRIKSHLSLSNYLYIYAYGDSNGDLEMLKLADEKYYCHFK